MAFNVSIGFDGIPEAVQTGPFANVVREEAMRATAEGLVVLKNGLVKASPFGGTGALRAGWIIVPPVERAKVIRGTVANATVQANVIEKGTPRKNPFPPVARTGEPALGVWIRRNLGESDPKEVRKLAFLIGRAIKKRGLPGPRGLPKRFFSRIVRVQEPQINTIMEGMAKRINERIGGE